MKGFKPKGLRIYATLDRDGKIARYRAGMRSRGRLGAATRAAFAALPEGRRQHVLHEWAQGHYAVLNPVLA